MFNKRIAILLQQQIEAAETECLYCIKPHSVSGNCERSCNRICLDMKNSQMVLKTYLFLLIFVLFAFQSCIDDKSRKNHKWTSKICNSLYAETFSTFGQGAFGGDRLGKWLTDSTNFRLYLGAFDEVYGKIVIECRSDSVFVTQFPDDLDVNKHLKKPVTKAYNFHDLIALNNFNDYDHL